MTCSVPLFLYVSSKSSILVIIYHVVITHVNQLHIVLLVHLVQCLVRLADVEQCYSTQITTAFSGTSKYHNVYNEEGALHKRSRTKYSVALSQNRLRPYLVSRSLIIVPLLICIDFYAVLFKRTAYLEGGRHICEANKS